MPRAVPAGTGSCRPTVTFAPALRHEALRPEQTPVPTDCTLRADARPDDIAIVVEIPMTSDNELLRRNHPRLAPHRTAPHRTAPHRTTPHHTTGTPATLALGLAMPPATDHEPLMPRRRHFRRLARGRPAFARTKTVGDGHAFEPVTA